MAWISKAETHRRRSAALEAARAVHAERSAQEPGRWVLKSHPRAPYWTCERGWPLRIVSEPPSKFLNESYLASFAA